MQSQKEKCLREVSVEAFSFNLSGSVYCFVAVTRPNPQQCEALVIQTSGNRYSVGYGADFRRRRMFAFGSMSKRRNDRPERWLFTAGRHSRPANIDRELAE